MHSHRNPRRGPRFLALLLLTASILVAASGGAEATQSSMVGAGLGDG
jgi:hypothetical protein